MTLEPGSPVWIATAAALTAAIRATFTDVIGPGFARLFRLGSGQSHGPSRAYRAGRWLKLLKDRRKSR